jgi:DNA-binding protein HU-beta
MDVVMNKRELATAMAAETGLTIKDAEKFLAALEVVVTKVLVDDKKIQIVGFFTIDVVSRSERDGRNPQTGEPIRINASKTPRIRAGKNLKGTLNGKS